MRPIGSMLLVVTVASASAAAPFVNLDFETPPNLPNDLIPGWSSENARLQFGPDVCLGSACITLLPAAEHRDPPVGRSVFIQSGVYILDDELEDFVEVSADLSQTGDLPTDARTILVESRVDRPSPTTSWTNLRVAIDDVDVPLSPVGDDGTNIVLGGDVSAFAGRTVELTVYTIMNGFADGEFRERWAYVNGIEFGSAPIPEPTTAALVTLMAVSSAPVRRLRRQAARDATTNPNAPDSGAATGCDPPSSP